VAPCFLNHGFVRAFSKILSAGHPRVPLSRKAWSQSPGERCRVLKHAFPEFYVLERHKGVTESRSTNSSKRRTDRRMHMKNWRQLIFYKTIWTNIKLQILKIFFAY